MVLVSIAVCGGGVAFFVVCRCGFVGFVGTESEMFEDGGPGEQCPQLLEVWSGVSLTKQKQRPCSTKHVVTAWMHVMAALKHRWFRSTPLTICPGFEGLE